ncbi:hypothetical protein NHX12_024212 [Muraenolepis orangiensis]|uniref:RING-type domain-containing protein n=1 Tax=Muraenolepis orangiensis TaxID=630683 RepID=A0A9Q0IUK9_9TELE|nr:hypothetical protein NHX12_024212 [Muraenolepis orangiensis]
METPPRPRSRLGPRVRAGLDVALRVPCVFIIDGLLNHQDPDHNQDQGKDWTGLGARGLLRVLGLLTASLVLLLSQKALLRFYRLFLAAAVGGAVVLINYYAAANPDFYDAYYRKAPGFRLLPRSSPSLWLGVAAVQIALGGLLLEDTWRRLRLPHVLRAFWLTRMAAQALILLYVVRAARRDHSQGHVTRCDSTLTVLGMSAVISSLAHYLGLSILLFIGSTEEEDKRLGVVAPVLFFILALQTGLSGLDPPDRLVRLSRNMCLLLTAVLHFIHGMTDPVLMTLSSSHSPSPRRHLPVLLVSLALLLLPVQLSYFLWNQYALNTWLFAVTAFCVELCLKVSLTVSLAVSSLRRCPWRPPFYPGVPDGLSSPQVSLTVLVSLTVYVLLTVDGLYEEVLWERLDDYVFYVRSAGGVCEFLVGVAMLLNGGYTVALEAGGKLRAAMMFLHAYFNIYLQAQAGWRSFRARRSALLKVASLEEAPGAALRLLKDVCSICYQEFGASARVTPCRHYFHAACLRRWLSIRDSCPMCHRRLHGEEPRRTGSRANPPPPGRPRPPPPPAPPPPGVGEELEEARREEAGDNDSIEYDEEEWGGRSGGEEEDYLDEESDSD